MNEKDFYTLSKTTRPFLYPIIRQKHYWDKVSLFKNVHNVHFNIHQLQAPHFIKVNKNISIMFFTKFALYSHHTSQQIMSSSYLIFPGLLYFFFFKLLKVFIQSRHIIWSVKWLKNHLLSLIQTLPHNETSHFLCQSMRLKFKS